MLFAFIQLDLYCGHCQSQYAEFNIYAQQIYKSGPQRLITCMNGMYELRNSGSDDQPQFSVPTHPIRLRFRVNAYVVRARCVLGASCANCPAATIIHLFVFACISVLCALCVGLCFCSLVGVQHSTQIRPVPSPSILPSFILEPRLCCVRSINIVNRKTFLHRFIVVFIYFSSTFGWLNFSLVLLARSSWSFSFGLELSTRNIVSKHKSIQINECINTSECNQAPAYEFGIERRAATSSEDVDRR